MSSPVFYIVVALMLASATLSLIFFLAWKTMGKKPYALTWSIGFLAATGQWFLNLNSAWFPNHESYWLTVNAFALVLITLGIRGHCQRTECTRLPKNLWPFTGVVYLGLVWSTALAPHVGMQMALVPASAAVTLLYSAFIIIRHRKHPRPAEWAAATSMVIFALTQGVAAGMAAMQGALGDEAFRNLYMHYNFLTLPAGYIAMAMFVIFMLASDVSEMMKEIAVRDQLTGLLNRRGMAEQGSMAFSLSRRQDTPISVIMTDIDRFKFINDQYGHAIGDLALFHFANLLSASHRTEDILARVGGEEFALILPNTGSADALIIADALCANIENNPMQENGITLPMTASFGVATVSVSDTSLTDIIAKADRALYRSKRAGRNQVDLESSQSMRAKDGSLKPIAV